MARNVRIYANRPGFLLEEITVYQNSQTPENVLAENLSYDEWSDGIVVKIPDEETTVIAVCMTGSCADQSSSMVIPPIVGNVRFFDIEVTGSNGQVQFVYPTPTALGQTTSQTVDYRDYSAARVLAAPSPSSSLVGWYTASADTVPISSVNPLVLTRNTYPNIDKYYAKFTDYTLSATTASIGVSGSVTFNLETRFLQDGTTVAYTASGLNNRHLSSGSLTGSFIMTNNTGSRTITIGELTSSLSTQFSFSLTNASASAVQIGVISQSYDISASTNTPFSANTSFEIYTTGHKDNDELEFRVTAYSASVSGSILASGSNSGSMFVHNNTGSYTFQLGTSAYTGSDNIFNLYLKDKPHISHSISLYTGSI